MRREDRIAVHSLSLLLSGCGLGWIVGLSVSPVVGVVVAAVVGAAASLVSALAGLEPPGADNGAPAGGGEEGGPVRRRRLPRANPVPLTLFILGLVLGSIFGIQARTHGWLAPDTPSTEAEIKRWTDLGKDRALVVDRLFDTSYPPAGSKGEDGPSPDPAGEGVLYRLTVKECQELRTWPEDDLVRQASTLRELRKVAETFPDPATLRKIVEALCSE